MKFTNDANANGTGLKGEFPITFAELVEIFGQPKADINPTSPMAIDTRLTAICGLFFARMAQIKNAKVPTAKTTIL